MSSKLGALIAAAAVGVGAFLPWVTVSSIFGSLSKAGVEGDGVLTLVGAIVMAVLFAIWRRPSIIIGAIVSALVALVAVIDLIDVLGALGDTGALVSGAPGIGLYLTALGGIAGVVLGLVGQASLGGGVVLAPALPPRVDPRWGLSEAPTWGPASQAAPAPAPSQVAPAPAPSQVAPAPASAPAPAPAPPTPAPVAPVVHSAPVAPAGWFPDPSGQAQLRYWDGTRWTEHTHNHAQG